MVIELNKNPISDHTERYRAAGLSLEFLGEMAKAVSALQAAGYEPYDQLYGYAMHGNDQYITRFGGALGNRHQDGCQGYQDLPEALQGP